jgi:hypothetical protein
MAKLVYEFDLDEDSDRVQLFQDAQKLYDALHGIYYKVRMELKHGDEELSPHMENFLQDILDLSGVIIAG